MIYVPLYIIYILQRLGRFHFPWRKTERGAPPPRRTAPEMPAQVLMIDVGWIAVHGVFGVSCIHVYTISQLSDILLIQNAYQTFIPYYTHLDIHIKSYRYFV